MGIARRLKGSVVGGQRSLTGLAESHVRYEKLGVGKFKAAARKAGLNVGDET
jgi:hypothetical protein